MGPFYIYSLVLNSIVFDTFTFACVNLSCTLLCYVSYYRRLLSLFYEVAYVLNLNFSFPSRFLATLSVVHEFSK